MPMPPDLSRLDSMTLLSLFKDAAGELGILQVSDAPLDELIECQAKVDAAMQELGRRMSW